MGDDRLNRNRSTSCGDGWAVLSRSGPDRRKRDLTKEAWEWETFVSAAFGSMNRRTGNDRRVAQKTWIATEPLAEKATDAQIEDAFSRGYLCGHKNGVMAEAERSTKFQRKCYLKGTLDGLETANKLVIYTASKVEAAAYQDAQLESLSAAREPLRSTILEGEYHGASRAKIAVANALVAEISKTKATLEAAK